jgi:hypothetical protein
MKKQFIKISNLNESNTFLNTNGYVFCLNCSVVIGLKSKNSNNLNSQEQEEFKIYFHSKKCKIKEEKKITVAITGLKIEKLEKLKLLLETLFSNEESSNRPKLNIIIIPQTKETLLKFQYINDYSHVSILIIIHKVEGRLFLLGRNGFYNKVCQEFENILKGSIFFYLLYKNIFLDYEQDSLEEDYSNEFQFQTQSINNLIEKGDQKELKVFQEQNKILCLDDDLFDRDIERRKYHIESAIFKNYILNYSIFVNKYIEVKEEVPDEDKNLFNKLLQDLNKSGAPKQGFNCQIL